MTSFHDKSFELLKILPRSLQKQHDISFTHPSIIHKVMSALNKNNFNPKTILEPGCGSGEFLHILGSLYPHSSITGIDVCSRVVQYIEDGFPNNVSVEEKNFLDVIRRYDLIIGRPPFVSIEKNKIPRSFTSMTDGKSNLCFLFLLHAIQIIEENGIIAMIIPYSFCTALKFESFRDIIQKQFTILSIIPTNETIGRCDTIFIIQKKKTDINKSFIANFHNCTVFHEPSQIRLFKELYCKTTLNCLSMDVKVGTVSWNSHKDLLTNDNCKSRLIYVCNVKNGAIVNSNNRNELKKLFINKTGTIEPSILVHRGYGKGKPIFDFALINTDHPYLVENHLLTVTCLENIPREEKLQKLQNILLSFKDGRTKQFVHLYFGNKSINVTEFKYILPVYT